MSRLSQLPKPMVLKSWVAEVGGEDMICCGYRRGTEMVMVRCYGAGLEVKAERGNIAHSLFAP